MALGRCPECDRLVSIVPRGHATPKVVSFQGRDYLGVNPKACAWYPVAHERPEGGLCDGHRKEIR